jgi:hypothetical protein
MLTLYRPRFQPRFPLGLDTLLAYCYDSFINIAFITLWKPSPILLG